MFATFSQFFHLIEFIGIIQIWTASHSNNGKKMNTKLLLMLLSMRWGLIKEETGNFKRFVHDTWRRTCGAFVFKFYKMVMWSQNCETCRDVMISYGETVIKIWQSFVKIVSYDAYKLEHLHRSFIISCACRLGLSIVQDKLSRNLTKFLSQPPHMILWHLDKFHVFLTIYPFYTI